ncbi:HlyD family secretion protein, partial [Candidatus Poribacteria bacterium]|nr:HlyD family secretion protein [Candidatus Poribacteria bacterium]
AVKAAEARLANAKAALKQADIDFGRAEDLCKEGIAPKEILDKAQTGHEAAEAGVRMATEELRRARAALGEGERRNPARRGTSPAEAGSGRKAKGEGEIEEVQGPKFKVQSQEKAKTEEMDSRSPIGVEDRLRGNDSNGVHPLIMKRQAELDRARLNLSYTEIYAPVKGNVTRKTVEVGNNIDAGFPPLMMIVPLEGLTITANYKETQLKRVKVGQPVEIEVDTYPGVKLKGRVESIMAGTGAVFSLFPPENATGNFVKVVQRIPVKIVLEERANPDVLRVGMSVTPTIDTTR